MKPIFHKGLPLSARISLFVVLGAAILFIDARTAWLKPVRQSFMTISLPLYWVTSAPGRLWDWGDDTFVSREILKSENLNLKAENRVLQQKLQKMASIITENARLTELLNSSRVIEDDVLIARLVGVSPDPARQELILDKGSKNDVVINQAVLDAHGVAGLVIEVASSSNRMMLITDSRSAVPVQIVRNGVRFVVEGTGHPSELRVRYVPATADIEVGDLLVSSGLDGHYPANYPVAKVTSIKKDPTQPFLEVKTQAVAQLNRSRHFLLVRHQKEHQTKQE